MNTILWNTNLISQSKRNNTKKKEHYKINEIQVLGVIEIPLLCKICTLLSPQRSILQAVLGYLKEIINCNKTRTIILWLINYNKFKPVFHITIIKPGLS